MHRFLAPLALLPVFGSLGCATIGMKAVSSTEKVISTRKTVVPGQGVRVRASIDGTRISLRTRRGCKLVEERRVEVEETREADESLAEEAAAFTVGAIPMGIGIGLLADAPNVYDDDRNSRTFNSVGQTGVYVAGTVLTTIGGLFVLPATIEMLRVAAAGDVVTHVENRQGHVLDANVACPDGGSPIRTSVVLRAAGELVATPGTDAKGQLTIDVADLVPPDLAERAVVVEVLVADEVVGELEVAPILDVHRRRAAEREAEAWRAADAEACAAAPPEDTTSCRLLESYLVRFPDGPHAARARSIIADRRELTLAAPPDAAPEDAQGERCREACGRDCGTDESCRRRCLEEVCQ